MFNSYIPGPALTVSIYLLCTVYDTGGSEGIVIGSGVV